MYFDLWLQYIQVRKLFKGGNYSRAETMHGNTVRYIVRMKILGRLQKHQWIGHVTHRSRVRIAYFQRVNLEITTPWYFAMTRIEILGSSQKKLILEPPIF